MNDRTGKGHRIEGFDLYSGLRRPATEHKDFHWAAAAVRMKEAQ
jgi:hypothetical protein